MLSRLLTSRWKHLFRLVPLGAVVGVAFGFVFRDIAYGTLIGCAFGVVLGLLFAARNPS
ncbi:hypothetical protein IH601_05705 [Candidatus Bipolaricaulota bacterium]|nr:hypothetical protein [Candidatus Bipolaricaulota bacterium]